jgi:hypothetical protein
MSPIIFVLYLNELIKQVNDSNCQGVYVNEMYENVTMLLYADDLVLLGDNIGHLQRLLDNLSTFCSKWGLSVNMEKTKFMVFRNGGIIKGNEKVYFNGIRIRPTTYYKYLGLIISTRLSWSPAQKTLAQQAEKSMNCVRKLNYECNFSFQTSNEIFDKCVLPVLLYGCEIWGSDMHSSIENVLLKYCRIQLGVGSKSPSPAVRGECGRHSLLVYCYFRCIKYWVKLISLPDENLLKSCYNMLYNLCEAGRCNWATNVKNILFRFGFGYIWQAQWIGNPKLFLEQFRNCLYDCDIQTWNTSLTRMDKLQTLIMYKTELTSEPYLSLSIPQRIRSQLAKFRIGNHRLEIEVGRFQGTIRNERFCKLCFSVDKRFIEDEYHVLLVCPFYRELRSVYLNLDGEPKNLHTFVQIMSSKDEDSLIKLGLFVTNMFKSRDTLLLSL